MSTLADTNNFRCTIKDRIATIALDSILQRRRTARGIPIAAIGLTVLATVEEFAQLWVTTRTFDLLDLVCNGIGIAIGCWWCCRHRGHAA